MARIPLTVQSPAGFWPTLPLTADAEDFTWTDSTAAFADGVSFVNTGREILLARNDSGGALTITISSVVDKYNRTGDITTYSLANGDYAWFGPFKPSGWNQAGTNLLYAAASGDDMFFAVCRLPILD